DTIGIEVFNPDSDTLMQATLAVDDQRAVGDFLRQRVFEEKCRRRLARLAGDEVGSMQLGQDFVQPMPDAPAYLGDEFYRQAIANYRQRLQDIHVRGRQFV